MDHLEKFMNIAIEEAKDSLKEGNSGFGAVIIKHNELISKAHDTDKTSKDPTAHAEMSAIREAAKKIKGDFKGCVLVSTHEPCPMCSTAIVWSGIGRVAFGQSIQDSIQEGRRRIDLTCKEVFQRAGASIEIFAGINREECALLYNHKVRESVKQLRNADSTQLEKLCQDLTRKRLAWFSKQERDKESGHGLDTAYKLFLQKLDIPVHEAPIVERKKDRIVFHSKNFCPTLEACKILDLDTRVVCKQLNETATQELLRQLNPNLSFKRNYNKLRPHTPYCEEMIIDQERRTHEK